MYLLCRSNNLCKVPWKSSCVSESMTFVTASFISSIVSWRQPLSFSLRLGNNQSQREQGLDYREAEELSWCPSWSNSLWQGWSFGLVHCPGGNTTNPLANHRCCIDFLTPLKPLIIPHRLPAFLESLMPLKNWCSIGARCSKSSLKHSIRFSGIFSEFKLQFYCISFF